MALTNTAKPSAANITNTARVTIEETWATNTTTWATETRTWAQMRSKITNSSRPSAPSMTNTPKP